jgi:hypothetical protein
MHIPITVDTTIHGIVAGKVDSYMRDAMRIGIHIDPITIFKWYYTLSRSGLCGQRQTGHDHHDQNENFGEHRNGI